MLCMAPVVIEQGGGMEEGTVARLGKWNGWQYAMDGGWALRNVENSQDP